MFLAQSYDMVQVLLVLSEPGATFCEGLLETECNDRAAPEIRGQTGKTTVCSMRGPSSLIKLLALLNCDSIILAFMQASVVDVVLVLLNQICALFVQLLLNCIQRGRCVQTLDHGLIMDVLVALF